MSTADWLVTGNDGIDPARNFLGTTDNQPLTIKTNGAERVRVDTNGNVGIGTSGPGEKLQIEGGDIFVNGEGDGVIVDAAGLKRIGLMKYPGKEAMLIGSNQLPTPIRLGRWEGGTITAPGQIHEDLVINSQGSVGIGTQSPASKLHINVDASPNPIKALTVEVKSFSTRDNAQASYFFAVQQPVPVLTTSTGGAIGGTQVPLTPGSAPLSHFVIRGDGNVGIGTSQPTETLHVNGNIRVVGKVGIGTDTPEFILDVNERIRLRAEGPANTAGLWLFQASKDQAFVGMATDSQVGLFGNSGANWGLVMDTANGNVGIGGTGRSPVSKLHVDVAASPNPIGAMTIDVESFENLQNAQASYFLRVRDIGASSLPPHFLIRGDGNVGIGTASLSPSSKLTVNGNVTVSGDVFLNGADCAEHFDLCSAHSLEPGTVVIIDQNGAVRESWEAYDKKVAGVVSGAGEFRHAIVLDHRPSEEPRVPVALLGKVYCKVDARCSPIDVGDFRTTSPTPGHAMKALDPMRAMGSVIGKALRPLEAGQGMIPILIALQ